MRTNFAKKFSTSSVITELTGTSVLASQQLAGKIDLLKLLEVIEVLESSLGCSIPEEELTEANFSSVPVLLQMASRVSQGARAK